MWNINIWAVEAQRLNCPTRLIWSKEQWILRALFYQTFHHCEHRHWPIDPDARPIQGGSDPEPVIPGHLDRSALRPTTTCRHCRGKLPLPSTQRKLLTRFYIQYFLDVFFHPGRVFKSRNDSSMWSLGSKKRNNLDSKERFRKKSLDVKQSQLTVDWCLS